MFVSELINAVSKFSFGRKIPTESDRADYLFLLNLADCEYYACAKNSNLLRYELDIFFDAANNFANIPDNYIHAVYNNKIKLKELEEKEGLTFTKNENYYFLNNKLFINKTILQSKEDPNDNVVKQYVTLLVQPKRKQLVERVVNHDTEVDTPIYPEQYHMGLIHGAVYYLCQSHEGFITKIAESKRNWESAKQDLMAHYVKGV